MQKCVVPRDYFSCFVAFLLPQPSSFPKVPHLYFTAGSKVSSMIGNENIDYAQILTSYSQWESVLPFTTSYATLTHSGSRTLEVAKSDPLFGANSDACLACTARRFSGAPNSLCICIKLYHHYPFCFLENSFSKQADHSFTTFPKTLRASRETYLLMNGITCFN